MQAPVNEPLEQTLLQTCNSEFAYCHNGIMIGSSLKVVERIPLRSRGGGWNPRVQRCQSLLTSVIRFSVNAEMQTGPGTKLVIYSHVDFSDFVRLDLFQSDFRLALLPLIILGVPSPSVVLLWI